MSSGDTVWEVTDLAVTDSYRQQVSSTHEWTASLVPDSSGSLALHAQLQGSRSGANYPEFDSSKRYKLTLKEV